MRVFVTAALIGALAAPAPAQQKLVETIEVRVVNIDVTVTDRAGNPVTGLTKADFELYENGKAQPITNLYEVRPEGAPAVAATAAAAAAPTEPPLLPPEDMRVRRIVVLIDTYSIDLGRRNQMAAALERFIDQQMHANDEMALAMWNQRLQMLTPFTSDKAALKAGVKTVMDKDRAGRSMQSVADEVKKQSQDYLDVAKTPNSRLSFRDAYDMSRSGVAAYAMQSVFNSRAILSSMKTLMGSLAGVDGKKVLIFAGADLPERPGADLYYFLYSLYSPYIKNLPVPSPVDTAQDSQVVSIEELAREANANGVTLYPIDTAGLRGGRGAETNSPSDATEEFVSFANTAMALQALARITGGVALTGTSNFDIAFQTVTRDLTAYYSLGYKPADDKSASARKVVVKAKNPAYRVRSRQTYTPKTTDQDIGDRVLANVYHGGMKGEWPVSITAGSPEQMGGKFKVPMKVSMTSQPVTLLPDGEKLIGGFFVYIIAGNEDGNASNVTKAAQKIEIAAADEKKLRSIAIEYNFAILLRPGENTISIAVVDQISNTTGFAKTKVVAR